MIRAALDSISLWAIPVLLVGIPLVGLLRKIKVYDVFLEGAKEGFTVAVRIIPFLVGLYPGLHLTPTAEGGSPPEADAFTNGTWPAASARTASRRHGQCVICASRNTRRREPTISGRSGRARAMATAKPANRARTRRDIAASVLERRSTRRRETARRGE